MRGPGWRLRVLRRIHWWPPLLGAGIKVTRMDDDYRAIDVEMRLTRLNRNVMGSHFGGSLYAMTDPFYMLMLMENLGREYIVWDKAANIRYKRPGIGTVRVEFRLPLEKIVEIRSALEEYDRYEPVFLIEVKDSAGKVVAEVDKTIYCAKRSVHEARKAMLSWRRMNLFDDFKESCREKLAFDCAASDFRKCVIAPHS